MFIAPVAGHPTSSRPSSNISAAGRTPAPRPTLPPDKDGPSITKRFNVKIAVDRGRAACLHQAASITIPTREVKAGEISKPCISPMSSPPPLHPMGSGFYYRDHSAPVTEDAPLFERWKAGIETNSYNGIILGKLDLLKSLYLVTFSDTLLIDEFHDAQGKSVFKIVPINEQRVLF